MPRLTKRQRQQRKWSQKNKVRRRYLQVRSRYGLSFKAYDELKAANPICRICEVRKPDQVDHSHVTGKVRGLLCKPCNVALGLIGDDIASVLRALRYLERAC